MESLIIGVNAKYCTKCKKLKSLDDFHDAPKMRLGKQSRCKQCQAISTKRWKRESTDAYQASMRKTTRKYKAYWRTHNPRQETKEKVCPHCRHLKLSIDFDECHSVSDGLQSWCRECNSTKLQKVPWGQLVFWTAKSRAKRKGIEFSIKAGDIVVPSVCPVLGIPLYVNKGKAGPNSPSLDRIDNRKGYMPGNVCVISYRANILKGDATVDEVERILKYMKERK